VLITCSGFSFIFLSNYIVLSGRTQNYFVKYFCLSSNNWSFFRFQNVIVATSPSALSSSSFNEFAVCAKIITFLLSSRIFPGEICNHSSSTVFLYTSIPIFDMQIRQKIGLNEIFYLTYYPIVKRKNEFVLLNR